MSDATVAALERELAVFVRRARAAAERMSRQVHPELDAYAYGLLARLADQGPQRSIDLAEHVGVGKATITRQLKPLEALGLISRLPDPDDGRAHLVELTPRSVCVHGDTPGAVQIATAVREALARAGVTLAPFA